MQRPILIIKHGALGDMVLATAAFAAIRAHHPGATITLLTTRPYAAFFAACPYVDEIWVDAKPKPYNLPGIFALYRLLNRKRWEMVYDLQTSRRSSAYWWLFRRPRPAFSGVARYASHRYRDPDRHSLHALEHDRRQLAVAGITSASWPDLSWMQADIQEFHLPPCYALLVPGGAAHRPEKRWPAAYFSTLAKALGDRGLVPVLIGGTAEEHILTEIQQSCEKIINLSGRTSIQQLSMLAKGALLSVGNDTGPMHVIAASGCPSLVLFSAASDPARSAPQGEHVKILRREKLADLSPEEVLEKALSLV